MVENNIETIHLFPLLDDHLIQLLKSLDKHDWDRRTPAKQWSVRDVASHLLDGNLRAISIYRDHFLGDPPPVINSYQDLVDYLNELNGSWVKATRRLSPALLTGLLESTGKEYHHQLSLLDPTDNAIFPVAWAGEEVSPNWFHIAREYTEKFHHQMQIREAVRRTEELITQELFRPFIHTLLLGLPHHYRNTEAPENSAIEINVSTDAGGQWFLLRRNGKWALTVNNTNEKIIAAVSIPAEIAWKLFTKGMNANEARRNVRIEGDTATGATALEMIAVMA